MKKHLNDWGLAVIAMVIALVALAPSESPADRTSNTLMNAQTRTGIGTASMTSTGTEEPDAHYVFQFHGTGNAEAIIEMSADGGTTWAPVHRFHGPDDVWVTPVCGGCIFRANAITASVGNAATVIANVSGSTTASAPTYTATATSTATATPTRTPTPTATATATPTP